MAIIFSYVSEGADSPAVYVAGGFETDCESYRNFLLKEILDVAGLDSSTVQIIRSPGGKPQVDAGDKSYSFSVSHSKGFIAMAFALSGETGLDTEKADRMVKPELLKRIVCADNENTEKQIGSLKLWTLKEAYLKLTGKGLRHPMNKVKVSVQTDHKYQLTSDISGQTVGANVVSFLYRDFRISVAFTQERLNIK